MIFEPRFHDGELVTQSQDCGTRCNPEVDSMFLTSNTYYLLGKKFDHSKFFTEDGKPRRYYRSGIRNRPEFTDPRNVSRDNLMGMFVYLGANKEFSITRRLAGDILKRGSFFPNTHTTSGDKKLLPDLCGPSTWATILRSVVSFKSNPVVSLLVYPLLHVLDAYNVLKTLFTVYFSPVNRASTVYHTFSSLHFGTKRLPTVFSLLSYKLFTKLRKPVPGYDDKSGVVSALKYYSRGTFDPPIYEIVSQVLRQ